MSNAPFAHFLAVRDGLRPPRWKSARHTPVAADGSTEERHAAGVAQLKADERAKVARRSWEGPSLLDLKIEMAARALDECRLCPHECAVNRNQGERGYCGVGNQTAIHWEGVLHGEEIELVPSHEVFLSGCTMRCAFCYSHRHITRPMSGQLTAPEELARLAATRYREGATNLNLVGGEPTVHIPNILRALRALEALDAPLPLVWNSNLYATPAAMTLLDGVVDLFLGDIHFGNPECARELGRIPDYLPSLYRAFEMAYHSGASVVIRHLIMPGHLECCARPAMEWAKSALPEVPFHLMFQYLPDYRAVGDPIIGRPLATQEIAAAKAMAQQIGVRLYQEDGDAPAIPMQRLQATAIGESTDIVIHADGRLAFTRLLGELLPVARAMNADDPRVKARPSA